LKKHQDQRLLAGLQASEKVYVDFQLESLNWRSQFHPVPGQRHLSPFRGPRKIAEFLSVSMNEITRNYFLKTAALSSGQNAEDMRGSCQRTS